MRRQLVPGPVVRLTVIKAKTRPGIEARLAVELQHGADLRLFQLVARKQPYLLSLSVQSG